MTKKISNPPPPTKRENDNCSVTMMEMQKVFTEWDRRYRDDPDSFMSEAARLLKETPKSYGEACATYFMKLLHDVKSGAIT